MRYFIEISYLGTHFHGWQLQNNAKTVQGELEHALSMVLEKRVQIHGSSRTDTGVHAKQQFAHFDLEHEIQDTQGLVHRLNRFLTPDIAVVEIYNVEEDAHSRFDATGRLYIYRILEKKDPFLKDYAAIYTREKDLEAMRKATLLLFNYTDFQCFSKVKTDVYTFDCTILFAEWVYNNGVLEFQISANRFLRGMVRTIVGTILDVGFGKLSVEGFESVILGKDRRKAGMAAKAEGLTLERVYYPEGYFDNKG